MWLWKCVVFLINSHVSVIVNRLLHLELILCASYTHPEEVFTHFAVDCFYQHEFVKNRFLDEGPQSNGSHILKITLVRSPDSPAQCPRVCPVEECRLFDLWCV